MPGFNCFNAFCRRQVLRHGSANVLYGFPNLLPYFKMCFIGLGFSPYLLFTDLILSLGRTEEVGGQFCTPHMVQDILPLFQTFPFMDSLRS